MFIFGDLNYRICLPNEVVRPAVERKDWALLKQADELLQAVKSNQHSDQLQFLLFRDYTEGDIDFPPTYKYDKRSQKYDTSKKQRVPSWCDRILWKKNPERVKLQTMGSLLDITFSDHRPVFAQFEIVTNKISFEKTLEMEEKYF